MTSPAGDRDLGQALYAVKDHVDDLVQSTLSPEEAWDYAQARAQYRALMQLTSRTGIVNPSSGAVSGSALANKLQQSDRLGFTFGKNQTPLYQAARFAQAFKPIVGDSGTATRSAGHGILGPLALGIAGHVTGLPLGENVALAAAPLAGRVLGNLAARAYLTRPGAALVRGALAAPRLAASGARALALNPALYALITHRAPLILAPAPINARRSPRRPPPILPTAFPGALPQSLNRLIAGAP